MTAKYASIASSTRFFSRKRLARSRCLLMSAAIRAACLYPQLRRASDFPMGVPFRCEMHTSHTLREMRIARFLPVLCNYILREGTGQNTRRAAVRKWQGSVAQLLQAVTPARFHSPVPWTLRLLVRYFLY